MSTEEAWMDREHGQMQTTVLTVIRPLMKWLWRIKTVGLDHIPVSGPAILAPNHNSVIDSFFLPCVLPRRVSYVGKAEYLDDWKTRTLFPALGMIPIDRSGGDASARALDTAASVLEAGELFGIYPEGTRSRDGLLHKGHTGAARLSVRTGAPIVPVGILGTRAIQPPDRSLPRPFRPAEIRFGRPIHPAESGSITDDRLRFRQITDEVMFEIGELSRQTYVDVYSGDPLPDDAPTLRSSPSVDLTESSSPDDATTAA
jgi:1-acyl-sn-glycerol-3-phosphate acyltransferase